MALHHDTIFALSSGRLPAAIAVVRISGAQAGMALTALSGGALPPPRTARLSRLRDPQTGEVLDEALLLWFPAPRSETGEDTAELHLHGGPAVVAGVLRALGALPGLRRAEPGEFTRRAFENGRLDLPAVEGLADLIAAQTEAQRRQAFRQMTGLLGDRAQNWRNRLIDALALVEARIDFSDEADVPEDLMTPAREIVRALHAEIGAAIAGAARGERLREGFVVAIAGPPNAGKSTLLNALARRDVAIVSPIPGTTRDSIEVSLDLDGVPVMLVDTAGLRETDDPLEREGVRRARERAAAAADLVLWVVDGAAPVPVPVEFGATSDGEGIGWSGTPPPVWVIRNKADLWEHWADELVSLDRASPSDDVCIKRKKDEPGISYNNSVSAVTGEGLAELLKALSTMFGAFTTEPALVTRQRQRALLEEAWLSMAKINNSDSLIDEVLVAEHLRHASHALGRLTGRIDVEDVLDRLFGSFCIGK